MLQRLIARYNRWTYAPSLDYSIRLTNESLIANYEIDYAISAQRELDGYMHPCHACGGSGLTRYNGYVVLCLDCSGTGIYEPDQIEGHYHSSVDPLELPINPYEY